MDSNLDRLTESFNSLQALKIDQKQCLFASVPTIGAGDSLAKSSGSALNHTIQTTIDHWASKRSIDYVPIISTSQQRNLTTVAAPSIIKPQSAKLITIPASLLAAPAVPAPIKPPTNIAPQSLTIPELSQAMS